MRKTICIMTAIIISVATVGCSSYRSSSTGLSSSTNYSDSSPQSSTSQLSTEEVTEIIELQTEPQAEETTVLATEPPTEAPKTVDDYVTTYRSESVDYTDSVGTSYSCEYAVPQINLDSVDAQKANTEIQEEGNNCINNALKSESDKTSLIYRNITYNAYLNDNVLSVVFVIDLDLNNYSYYFTYNFNVNTGKLLNNTDMTQYLSCTEEELYSRVRTTIDNHYIKQDVSNFENSMADYYYTEYNRSLSDENIKQATVYLTKDGIPYS